MHGIIIRTHPSGDDDLVVKLLTSLGSKVTLFARHARKSRKGGGGSLDILDYGSLELKPGKGSLTLLSSFNPISSFPRIREDLDKLTVATTICEAFDLLLPEQGSEDAETFQALLLAFQSLDEARELKIILRTCFLSLTSLIRLSGFESRASGQAPSANGLSALLDQIERIAERKLAGRDMLDSIVEDLRKTGVKPLISTVT